MTAIIGPSGTGKSTLVRCINRLVDPTAGEILFRGQDLVQLRGRELRAGAPPHRHGVPGIQPGRAALGDRERAVRAARLCAGVAGLAAHVSAPAESIAPFELLDAVGLGDFATQRADQLSGGQRQRVGIARALMQEPDLMLADEPTSSLDPKTSVEIMELIARRAGERDIPVIVNIHNVELARRFADRIIGMSKGEIVFDGPPRALAGLASAADLRRRRMAGVNSPTRTHDRRSTRAAPRRLPAELAGADRACSRSRSTSSMPARSSTSPGRASSPGSATARASSSRMFPPNVAPDKLELLYSGMIESLQIAIIATVVGRAAVAAARACRRAQPVARCRSPGRRAR